VGSETVLISAANSVRVRNRAGFNNGDVVVLANSNATDCRLVEITSTDTAVLLSDKAFAFDTTAYQALQPDGTSVSRTPVFNQAGGVTGATFTTAFDLGQTPQANQWRISTTSPNSAVNPALQRFSIFPINGAYPTPRGREVAEGIINLQAQYGYDANGNGRIEASEWVDADANHAPKITSGAVDWRRVLAIRYAILARSRNYEPAPYIATKPTWVGAAACPGDSATEPLGFCMTDLGGTTSTNTGDASDWHNYRYSVAEGVIPLRNALWGRNQ
jgi:type IV pilus assembly protein PilW